MHHNDNKKNEKGKKTTRNSWKLIQQPVRKDDGEVAEFHQKGRLGRLGRLEILGMLPRLISLQGYECLETLECLDSFDSLDS